MNESVWETFNELFKTVHRQARRVEELEQRVLELEHRLSEREQTNVVPFPADAARPVYEVAG